MYLAVVDLPARPGKLFHPALAPSASYICIGYLQLTISSLKQLILDQTRQSEYQMVPFGVYIHNLIFVFILE